MAAATWVFCGRPNVGKSTLFNRCVGKRLALTADTPGVTRDYKEYPVENLVLVDSPGVVLHPGTDTLLADLRRVAATALDRSDGIVLVVDGATGITADDRELARWLRRFNKPVVVAVTKADLKASRYGEEEAGVLGFDQVVATSGREGLGVVELLDRLRSLSADADYPPTAADPPSASLFSIACIGRPNVGKSTLVNALLGQQRVLTGPVAGLTRDAISTVLERDGVHYRLVDTAGVRKKGKIDDDLERAAVQETLHALRFAQVVVLVLDASQRVDKQDLHLGSLVAGEGRALVVALNKWDLIKNKKECLEEARHALNHGLPQCRNVPLVPLSALKKQDIPALLQAVHTVHQAWTTRIPTARLNAWFQEALNRHPEPVVAGRRVRLRYITQIKSKPPTFRLFTTRPTALPDSYIRYLENSLREVFNLPGIPLRMEMKKTTNPYVGQEK